MADGQPRLSRYDVATSDGPAAVELTVAAGDPKGLLVLGHGAGGGIGAPDLTALAVALPPAGVAVARVEQPYRVAGRRTPPSAPRLDAAWLEIVALLRTRVELAALPMVVGGRSSGARVACRTGRAVGASGVVALAFPLRPPGRPASRRGELLGAGLPTLVVQGDRDPFGGPADFPSPLPADIRLVAVPGADHSFRCRRADGRTSTQCLADVVRAVADWLDNLLRAGSYPDAAAVTKTLAATRSGTATSPLAVRRESPSAAGPTTSTTASGTRPPRSSSSM